MAYKNLTENEMYKTGRDGVVLEILDKVYPNKFDFNNNINNDIFKKYSSFRVTLVDSRRTKGTGTAVYYNLGTDEALLLSYLLSDGNADAFKKRVGAFNAKSQTDQIFIRNIVETFDKIDIPRYDRLFDYGKSGEATSITFQKNINTSGDDLLIRKFTLSYEDAMRSASKWKITIEEGTGKKDINKGNGLNIIKAGSFKSTIKSYLMLQVEEVVIPINEAASRVMIGRQAFYPIMKAEEVDFTNRKLEEKDYTGERIDQWNPQGKSTYVPRENAPEDKEVKERNDTRVENETKDVSTDLSQEENKCSSCDADISNNVYQYSTKRFNKALCFNCQKKANA